MATSGDAASGTDERRSLARVNHFLPRDYTRPWTDEHGQFHVYRILVPSGDHRVWEPRTPDNFGYQRDLYTDTASATESDKLERWLHEEIEQPAQGLLARLRADEELSDNEWEVVHRYVFALAQRTPKAFGDHLKFMEQHLPRLLSNPDLARRAEREMRRKNPAPTPEPPKLVPLRTTVEPGANGRPNLRVEALAGRHSWLQSIQHAVQSTLHRFPRPKWSVLRPCGGWMWFTSDVPVTLFCRTPAGRNELGGAWDVSGTQIVCPISPHHLLHATIRAERSEPGTLSSEATRRLQDIMAQGAWRVVIARRSHAIVEAVRPRVIDKATYVAEQNMWRGFHEEQRAAETEFGLRKSEVPRSCCGP